MVLVAPSVPVTSRAWGEAGKTEGLVKKQQKRVGQWGLTCCGEKGGKGAGVGS